MQDLQTASFNLDRDYINNHLDEITEKFKGYEAKIKEEYEQLKSQSDYLDKVFKYDAKTGSAKIQLDKFTGEEQLIYKIIKSKYSYTNFFFEKDGYTRNRNEVYYSVGRGKKRKEKSDGEKLLEIIKTCVFLESNILLLDYAIENSLILSGSFIVASLLDDIRYKLILLYEDVLSTKYELRELVEPLVEDAIRMYYSYLLNRPQTTYSKVHFREFILETGKFINQYLKCVQHSESGLREDKEADHPKDNLLFIHKLKKQLPDKKIDFIVGIRFGGIELPYLVKYFVYPEADVCLVRKSNYTDKSELDLNFRPEIIKGKNVMIVDDNVTTGRTVMDVIRKLKELGCKNIYFGCISFGGSKRIKDMQKDDHGGVNPQQLEECCVLTESPLARAVNIRQYKNYDGIYDKRKHAIEKHLAEQAAQKPSNIPYVRKEIDGDSKSMFIICNRDDIPLHFEKMVQIRDHLSKEHNYVEVDDWLDKRVSRKENKYEYEEVEGRNFLSEAIADIDRSKLVVIYYPIPSPYVAALHLYAAMKGKKILLFYSRSSDIEEGIWERNTIDKIHIRGMINTLKQWQDPNHVS